MLIMTMIRIFTWRWCYVVLQAPMDNLWQKSHMGRWYFHSTEVVWEMIARKEWLGCRRDTSPMFDIPGSTPVWAQYIYIYIGFSRYKNLYVLCFQIYMYYQITLVVSDLVLDRWGSEKIFVRLKILKEKKVKTTNE